MAIDPKSRDIEGHAWVELGGAPLLEAVDPRLIVTARGIGYRLLA